MELDGLVGSNLQLGNEDTVGDLIADSLSSALRRGAARVLGARGWGSVRRIPGETRYEDTEALGARAL